MSELVLGGRPFRLDPLGALVDVAGGLLIVSDLHFETGSAYARRGALLPPYDTMATLTRLATVLARWQPRQVISLGDGFHDRHGPASLPADARDGLRAIMAGRDWIWVTGNHDPVLPAALGGWVLPELSLHGIDFRHVPARHPAGAEIAGHLHPKARIAGRRLRLSRPCFVSDGQRLLLPAFGALTGGLNARHATVRAIFPEGYDVWLLGEARVFRIPHRHLLPDEGVVEGFG